MERRQERQRGQPRRQELRARDNLLYASDSYCNGALRVNELPGQGVPLLGQEGWLRHQENAAKPPYEGADGVVIMVYVCVETLSGTDHPVCAFIRRLRSICRGRNGDHSPPPARIRTYRFPISGSCLRSAAKAGRRIRMTDDSGRNPSIEVTRHAVPRQVASLAPATQPFLP